MENQRQSHIGRLLLELNRDFTGSAVEIIRASGYPDVQMSHVFFIAAVDLEGTPLSVVIERTGSSKQAINRVLLQLENLGLVERLISDEDSRSRIVHFTRKGREFMKVAMKAVRSVEAEFQKALGNADFMIVKKHLTALAEKRGIFAKHLEE